MKPARRVAVVLVLVIASCAIAVLTLRSLLDAPEARRIDSLSAFTRSRVVLGVFAHPDDEILVTTVLADAARRGCAVHTVTATRGERGMPPGFRGDVAALMLRREAELRSLGARIGIREQVLWNFEDGALEQDERHVLEDSIAAAIRRVRPDLVVTFDSSMGGTGHPDHRRVGAAVLGALEATGEAPMWLARVVVPRRAASLIPNPELRRRIRQQPPADVAVRVDGRVKLLGMRTHATQARFLPPTWTRPLLLGLSDHEFFALTRVR